MLKNSAWEKAAEFVQTCNDRFDLFNSRVKFEGNNPSRIAFGTNEECQIKLLNDMSNLRSSVRVGKHKHIIQFQKGIILSNRSLLEMWSSLKEKYKIKYVLTSRLNQDVLENFFSYIRGMGEPNDHPSSIDIKYRSGRYILGRNSAAIFTENRNTMDSEESCLLNVFKKTTEKGEICITQNMLSTILSVKNILSTKATLSSMYILMKKYYIIFIIYKNNYYNILLYYKKNRFSDEVMNLIDRFKVKD